MESSNKLIGLNEQTNQSQRSISSRLASTLNSHQLPTSLTNNNQPPQFSTLQPNQQYKLRNSFNASKPINISLNELTDSKVDLPTRVNCEQLIDEIIETNLNENDQSVNENEVGLQLFVAKDGTTKLGRWFDFETRASSCIILQFASIWYIQLVHQIESKTTNRFIFRLPRFALKHKSQIEIDLKNGEVVQRSFTAKRQAHITISESQQITSSRSVPQVPQVQTLQQIPAHPELVLFSPVRRSFSEVPL